MILKNLAAWVTNPRGEQLEEFERVEVSENTVECWIPSTEGDNFAIKWQPIRDFEPGLGLRCRIELDGRPVSRGVQVAEEIARGITGKKTGMTVGPGQKRYFIFGSQKLTDCDELASPNELLSDLGTIRVTLSWTSYTTAPCQRPTYTTPQEQGYVHERAAKKGHMSAVGLGDVVLEDPRPVKWQLIGVDAGLMPMVFVFRYAPRDWLMAQEIIPRPPSQPQPKLARQISSSFKRKRSPSQDGNSQKRARANDTSEIIDVDDLETDDDSDVVVLNDADEPTQTTPVKAEKISNA